MCLKHFLPLFSIMETRGLLFCPVKIPCFDHRGPVPIILMNMTYHFQCPLLHSSPHPILVDMSGLLSTPAVEWLLPPFCTLPCSSPCELPDIYQILPSHCIQMVHVKFTSMTPSAWANARSDEAKYKCKPLIQAQWHIPVISALQKLRREDNRFKTSLGKWQEPTL